MWLERPEMGDSPKCKMGDLTGLLLGVNKSAVLKFFYSE